MAVKTCCIETCQSSATRPEDVGVTFHKFPKNLLRERWRSVTQFKRNIDSQTYVCSRHFCKNDFRLYDGSKYVLKTDATPSIFSWTKDKTTNKKMDFDIFNDNHEEQINTSSSSKESEVQNVEAIQKFIEDQEKELNKSSEIYEKPENNESQNERIDVIHHQEPVSISTVASMSTSVINMILSEPETKMAPINDKPLPKQSGSAGEKGNSVALTVGSEVEAKDYAGVWHAAKIIEVDYDEMEVLVHYEDVLCRSDEWITVNSTRLRPISAKPLNDTVDSPSTSTIAANTSVPFVKTTKEDMGEEKSKVTYSVGERCLARWRDNRRFVATITKELENGEYEVVFDDGFQWKCTTSRLYKYKKSSKVGDLSVDTTMSPSMSSPSPVLSGVGPSTGVSGALNPPFHTHLFDPTRDYLSSKTERREMKRKLNIKEIFNIGQKKKRISTTPPVKRAPVVREKRKRKRGKRRIKQEPEEAVTVKEETKELPDAVASIIGTVAKSEDVTKDLIEPHELGIKKEPEDLASPDISETLHDSSEILLTEKEPMDITSDLSSSNNSEEQNASTTIEPASEEESKLEKFEKPDETKHEKVMDKFKEVINKLEVGLNEIEKVNSPKLEIKCQTPEPIVVEPPLLVPKEEEKPLVSPETVAAPVKEIKVEDTEKPKKKLSKIKKTKKLRLLQEKKVKRQVERVKSELEEMKRQVEEMKKQMMMKTEELSKQTPQEMPENFLLPGEWCCKWINGQPVGTVCELETEVKDANNKPALPRRSVQVEDKRLPPGWTKHMVRRSFGQSAGKWDVVLIGPDNHRFHTKTDMRNYLDLHPEQNLRPYEHALLDFGVHLKLSRRMGWFKTVSGEVAQPTGKIDCLSPLVKRKSLSLKRKGPKKEKPKLKKFSKRNFLKVPEDDPSDVFDTSENANDMSYDQPTLEDGYVYVGSLKVQVIENLLRCPAEGCFKNFRNNTLLKMHIKHYHRELRKLLGVTPKVLDLAYARSKTKPTDKKPKKVRRDPMSKVIKVKIPRIHKRVEEPTPVAPDVPIEPTVPPVPKIGRIIPRSQDSPKLRQALANSNKPVKRPKVLLPVRRPDPPDIVSEMDKPPLMDFEDVDLDNSEIPMPLDFESAISTHTVTKPPSEEPKKLEGKKKSMSETEDWLAVNSDFETRSSFPGSGTPDSKSRHDNDKPLSNNPGVSSESNEDKEANMYMYTETGERIKIEHMKREEIINCHCGFREEDGLMVQCELCLCWQHALCHNIQTESQVPEKYTCSICLNPRRGRRSMRFLHDQDRLYEGLLPGARPSDRLRRSHELSGNLLRIQDALHALRVKYNVASNRNHPKLYLWAKDWESAEVNMTQERLNSDYSDLNIIINNIGKENLPVRADDLRDLNLDARATPCDDDNRDSQLMSLANALSSPGGTSLDLPISTSELERLAKSVQEQEGGVPGMSVCGVMGPQPEPAIESGACRERLLRHLRRCQALIDARLDSIEAQVAELESQDPSFEDDETADYFPRTKQTIQMLMRDLDTMEELGTIT